MFVLWHTCPVCSNRLCFFWRYLDPLRVFRSDQSLCPAEWTHHPLINYRNTWPKVRNVWLVLKKKCVSNATICSSTHPANWWANLHTVLEYNCFANVAVLHNDCLANFFLMNKLSCPIISRWLINGENNDGSGQRFHPGPLLARLPPCSGQVHSRWSTVSPS